MKTNNKKTGDDCSTTLTGTQNGHWHKITTLTLTLLILATLANSVSAASGDCNNKATISIDYPISGTTFNNVPVWVNGTITGANGPAGNFAVNISWGDGSYTPGVIPVDSGISKVLKYTYLPGHTYASGGGKTLTAILTHSQDTGKDFCAVYSVPINIIVCVPEVCNGIDDDCDGQVDDGLTRSTNCGTGACASTGTETCTAGVWGGDTCTPGTQTAEACDNVDNNCNGLVDEGLSRGTNCGVGECASTGTETCTAGTWGGNTCTPEIQTVEVCNNLDDDCNGVIDNGVTRPTSCGTGACSANTGTETCTAGTWGGNTCNPLDGSTTETCNNIDDDCDGTVDDGVTRPTNCGTGACAGNTGTETCTTGTWGGDTCNPLGGSTTEICDGTVDNDCDGTVDEGCQCTNGQTRTTYCGLGACSSNTGTETCVNGAYDPTTNTCDPLLGSSTEACDGTVDDDCDGAVDEGCDCTNGQTTPTSCGVGECADNTGTLTCVDGQFDPTTDTCDPTQGAIDEVCNGLDDDCDGSTDEVDGPVYTSIAPVSSLCTPSTDPCYVNVCQGASGCQPVATTAACDDGNSCTVSDVCSAGTCAGTPMDCSGYDITPAIGACDNTPDGNSLTWDARAEFISECDAGECTTGDYTVESECSVESCGAECDDSNPCPATKCGSGDDSLTYYSGGGCGSGCVCGYEGSQSCNDENACTADSCDIQAEGGCVNEPITCDDGNACTTDSCDTGTGCVYTPVPVGDDDVCTTDACDSTTGVSHTPIAGCCHTSDECSDDNSCNGVEQCISNTCQPGTPVTCGDNQHCESGECTCDTSTVYCGGNLCCSEGDVCIGLTPSAASQEIFVELQQNYCCTPTNGGVEICDGVDNNCDGLVDNGVSRETSCGVGACASTGVETCSAGVWGGNTCVAGTPVAEVCGNGVDDNCNGVVNENCGGGGGGGGPDYLISNREYRPNTEDRFPVETTTLPPTTTQPRTTTTLGGGGSSGGGSEGGESPTTTLLRSAPVTLPVVSSVQPANPEEEPTLTTATTLPAGGPLTGFAGALLGGGGISLLALLFLLGLFLLATKRRRKK